MNDSVRPRSIDEVLTRLESIIETTRREDSRLGYFAVLYWGVTERVRDGIRSGRFEDGERMERLDVAFATRYLEAYACYRRGERCSACWHLAFEAAERHNLIVLQHLLLGMNAHIDLDLSIAAAETAPGTALAGLERDFREINALLIEMLDEVQDRLSTVSPWLGLLDRVAGGRDERLARFGLRGTRTGAWFSAQQLALLETDARALPIEGLDRAVTVAGRAILKPPGRLFAAVLRLIRLAERRRPAEIIDALTG